MASGNKSTLLFLCAVLAIARMANGGDPDILTDFVVPPQSHAHAHTIDGKFFTFTGMRSLITDPFPRVFTALKANLEQLPALNGQGVSYAVLLFPGGSVNPVHTHPRASEILFVIQGSLEVGLVDSKNKLYTQTLITGDMFVFPKGLVHYMHNVNLDNPAIALSAYGSANPGTVSMPSTLFNSTIDDTVLALSFKTDVSTIRKLKSGLKGR